MHIIRKKEPEFVDARGAITKILDKGEEILSVLLITSRAGSVRANHYHKNDTHYSYLLSGKMEWVEQPRDGGEKERTVLEPGDMVYTPSLTMHAARALEDSVFLAFSTSRRGQEEYESDTVRVNLL